MEAAGLKMSEEMNDDYAFFTSLRSRKPLHRRCWQAKRPSGARETACQPFRVGDEGDALKINSFLKQNQARLKQDKRTVP